LHRTKKKETDGKEQKRQGRKEGRKEVRKDTRLWKHLVKVYFGQRAAILSEVS
jgi:hypothetical protein